MLPLSLSILLSLFFKTDCDDVTFQKYERYVLSSYISDSSFTKYCAAGGCNRIIEYPAGTKNRVIECVCGYEFCFTCELQYGHLPLQCNMIETWKDAKNSFKGMSSDELWWAQNVKKCPKRHGGCDRPINKNGGCMHMTCRKGEGGCGFEFCWLCLGPWSTHGSSTGGYFACNNYEKEGKSGKLTGEAKLAYEAASTEEVHKERLKFYEFYVQRHVFMRDSANGAKERDLSPLMDKLATCLSVNGDVKKRDTEKVQVLLEANKIVEKCRRVLQWVYVAAYYFPRNHGPYALFKLNHDALEGHTEHLNRLVSFGSQLDGVEKSWDQIIEEGGSANVADVLSQVRRETDMVKHWLDSFKGEAVFELYFREALRDTNKLPLNEAGVPKV